MIYLAACAIVFWFIFLPFSSVALNFGTFILLAFKGIRETEISEEQHLAFKEQVRLRIEARK